MNFTYRLIRPDEEATAVAFWSEMFAYDYDEMYKEYSTDSDRLSQTYVAVDPYGHIAATAGYCVRSIRDNTGEPQRTGCVWNVATAPQFQRRGLARHLMHITLDAMVINGCTWSFLDASPYGRPLYAQLQYTAINSPYWDGTIFHHPEGNDGYVVRTYDPRNEVQGWESLSNIYNSYNHNTPLTTVRDITYWTSGYAHYRYTLWLAQRKVILAAFTNANRARPIGYLAADFGEDNFQILEIGVMKEHTGALNCLISSAIQTALYKGYSHGRFWLSHDERSRHIISPFFNELRKGQENHIMARSLMREKTKTLEETIFSPNAMQWMIDNV